MKKLIAVFICAALCFGAAGCKNENKVADTAVNAPAQSIQKSTISICVGRGNSFNEYETDYEGELTAGGVLEKIAVRTGWNLKTNSEPKEENGHIQIDFSKESSVATGKTDESKKEFVSRDKNELVCMILDSVTKTVLKNFESVKTVSYLCGGEEIDVNGKNASEFDYKTGAYEKYSEDEALEFLKNHLSDYYDTPTTKYEKYGESFENGQRLYIYRAVDKNTNELLGTYKLSSDLWYLYETVNDKDELLWSMDSYM